MYTRGNLQYTITILGSVSAGNVLSAATKLTHYWLSTYLEHVDADHSRTPINYTFNITGLHNIK